jgi:hypothetical protein
MSPEHVASGSNAVSAKPLYACMGVQVCLLAILVLVPFGFDRRSAWGLDFGHLLIVLAIYAVAFLCGSVLAATQRRWTMLILQIAAPLAILAASFLLSSTDRPIGPDSAAPVIDVASGKLVPR